MGTVMTALACIIGEFIVTSGDESEQLKKWFLRIVDAYISTGEGGVRLGPGSEQSLIRRSRPWRGSK
jgi:hypothetical protein